jgi:hypothetical protein
MSQPTTNGVRHAEGADINKNPPVEVDDTTFSILNLESLSPSTCAVHADDPLNVVTDVAPPIHVSTTFRFAIPGKPAPARPSQQVGFV